MTIKSTKCHMNISWNTTHHKRCDLTALCNHKLNQSSSPYLALALRFYTCSYITCTDVKSITHHCDMYLIRICGDVHLTSCFLTRLEVGYCIYTCASPIGQPRQCRKMAIQGLQSPHSTL